MPNSDNNKYFQNIDENQYIDETLAESLDRAWIVYKKIPHTQEEAEEREQAQFFLVNILDISNPKDINGQIIKLMDERNRHKEENPEYIPGLSPRHLKLPPRLMQPIATNLINSNYGEMTSIVNLNKPGITKLMENNELLDINLDDRLMDITASRHTNMDEIERAQPRSFTNILNKLFPLGLIRISENPSTLSNEKLKSLSNNKPYYALFESSIWYINTVIDAEPESLDVESFKDLEKIFPKLFDNYQIASKKDLSEIKKLTNHSVDSPSLKRKEEREGIVLKTPFFNAHERAPYRVYIHKGKFYQKGKLFDTSGYYSHFKRNFASFTLNANGELSVFAHPSAQGEVNHSSLNSRSPVVNAGELIIKDGILKAIDSYSGHYRPSLFNLYRTLQYFADKNVDLSDTVVYSEKDPKGSEIHYFGDEIPDNLLKDNKGTYIYVDNDNALTKTLYYVNHNGIKSVVPIKNFQLFEEKFLDYYRKINKRNEGGLKLSKDQIQDLITSNGGHRPTIILDIDAENVTLVEGSSNYKYRDHQIRYKYRATDLIRTLKIELSNAIDSLHQDINNYKSMSFINILFYIKDFVTFSGLTSARRTIAEDLMELTREWTDMLSGYVHENKEVIGKFIDKLQLLKERNEKLSEDHGKDKNNGRLQDKITYFIKQLETLNQLDDSPAGEIQQMHLIY